MTDRSIAAWMALVGVTCLYASIELHQAAVAWTGALIIAAAVWLWTATRRY